MGGFRVLVALAVCTGVVLYLYYPEHVILIVLGEFVVVTLAFFITMRAVPEPDRAVIYRLARFHHVAGPGYVFLVPTFDTIHDYLDMSTHPVHAIEVPQVRTADNQHVRTNLEVTWRIHPDVQGRVSAKVKSMILMREDDKEHQRRSLVEEVVISMARQVVSSYTVAQLGPAANREAAAATMMDGANEILETYGLQVERIFWRGSGFPSKLSEAKLESAIQLEHAESLIKTVEAIRTHLPDMQPEEFLALQAWLDMFRRGGAGHPPTASG